jgi:hypothetical protein
VEIFGNCHCSQPAYRKVLSLWLVAMLLLQRRGYNIRPLCCSVESNRTQYTNHSQEATQQAAFIQAKSHFSRQWHLHHHTARLLAHTRAQSGPIPTPWRCSQPVINILATRWHMSQWPATSCLTPCHQTILTTRWLGLYTASFTFRCAATSVRLLCE